MKVPSRTRKVVLNNKVEELTGDISIQYAGKTWVVAESSFGPTIGPNGEIGYTLEVQAFLEGHPMPEELENEYRMVQGMPDETAQGESGTGNVSVQA